VFASGLSISRHPPELITSEQLRQYFIHLKCIKKVARQTSTQALCAIKLFWEKSLRRVWPASAKTGNRNAFGTRSAQTNP